MKKVILGVLLLMGMFLVGCSYEPSSDEKQSKQQEVILQEGTRQIGMPDITNFYERKQLKKILEMRDNPDLITYSYVKNVNGKYIYLGKSIGFGIPYATQFTNPQKVDGGASVGYYTLPQADPNGLFSPESANATWVMIVTDDGKVEPMYVEDNLTVTQHPIRKQLLEEWSIEGVEYN